MQIFECDACRRPVYFENTKCDNCGRRLGYLPDRATMTAIDEEADNLVALADPGRLYRFCANIVHGSCNWLITVECGESFCVACRHNRTIPNLSNQRNLILWRRIEIGGCRSLQKQSTQPGLLSTFLLRAISKL